MKVLSLGVQFTPRDGAMVIDDTTHKEVEASFFVLSTFHFCYVSSNILGLESLAVIASAILGRDSKLLPHPIVVLRDGREASEVGLQVVCEEDGLLVVEIYN